MIFEKIGLLNFISFVKVFILLLLVKVVLVVFYYKWLFNFECLSGKKLFFKFIYRLIYVSIRYGIYY